MPYLTSEKRWILLIILSIVLLRLTTLWTPILDVDEAIFSNFATRWLDGGIPYIDMLDNKPMGIFYLYALIFQFFGHGNMIAVHAVTMLIVGATCHYIYKITHRLSENQTSAFWAALFYSVFTTTYIPKYIATEIEIVMMLPLTMGIWYYIKAGDSNRPFWCYLFSGILSGSGIIFKYQAGINLAVIGLFWLWQAIRSLKKLPFQTRVALTFLLGYFLVPALMLLHLYSTGSLEAFYDATIKASVNYISAGMGTIHIIQQFLIKGATLILYGYILWVLAAVSFFKLIKPANVVENLGKGKMLIYLIVFWLGITTLPVVTGGRFYGHYFNQLVPAAAILAGILAGNLVTNIKWKKFLIVSVILSIIAGTGPRYMTDFIYKHTGEDNPNDYKPIAEYIKTHTAQGDFVYAWGFAPCIYLFSERHSSSRYPYTDPLVGRITGLKNTLKNPIDTTSFILADSWNVLWGDFAKNPPVYIVDTAGANLHGYEVYPIAKYPAFQSFLDKNYKLETVINKAKIYRKASF